VLSPPPSVRLHVATQPIDGRKGVDSLMVIVHPSVRAARSRLKPSMISTDPPSTKPTAAVICPCRASERRIASSADASHSLSAPSRSPRSATGISDNRRCPVCGSEMQTVCFSGGCEYLDVVPAELIVVQPKDETVRCPHDDTTMSADPAPRIVEDGKLGDTLLVRPSATNTSSTCPSRGR
jgi:hypothetical protein